MNDLLCIHERRVQGVQPVLSIHAKFSRYEIRATAGVKKADQDVHLMSQRDWARGI